MGRRWGRRVNDNISFAVFDFGLFLPFAERLASFGHKVGYFVPWETSFADGRELVLGDGIEGIHRIKYWDDEFSDYSCLVFPDCICGDLQAYYRRQGFRTWGSAKGANLELLRWRTKERFKELGLPVNECHRVKGTKALREFFKEHETKDGWFVKISSLRGLGETWFARNYAEAKGIIDEFDSKNGGLAYLIHFIIEAAIPDANEVGYDGFCIDGQFPAESFYGYEIKDKAYFGKLSKYEDLPDEVKAVNDALSDDLKASQYRNWLSTELRNEFCIDLTCRHASPAGEVLIHAIENLPEVIWEGAEGRLVEPQYSHKYGAQLIMTSEWAEEHWEMVSFPEELREWVKLYNHARVDDQGEIGMADYFVPQIAKMRQLGSVIALADDPQEAVDTCKERAEQIKGFDVEVDSDALDKALEEMEEVSSPQPSAP